MFRITRRKILSAILSAAIIVLLYGMKMLNSNSIIRNPLFLTGNKSEVVRRELVKKTVPMERTNPLDFAWTVPNKDWCEKFELLYNKPPELLLLVRSHPLNYERRQFIRKTWGNEECWGKLLTRRLFLLGVTTLNKTQSEMLTEEMRNNTDIAQLDFRDTYRNLTYKTMQGIRWAALHCSRASLIYTADEDIFVNPRRSAEYLMSIEPKKRELFYAGKKFSHMKVQRHPGNRHFVSKEQYPHDFYPEYLTGASRFISMPLVVTANAIMEYVNYFSVEDAFLGVVMKKMNITPIHNPDVRLDADCETRLLKVLMCHLATNFFSQSTVWKMSPRELLCWPK